MICLSMASGCIIIVPVTGINAPWCWSMAFRITVFDNLDKLRRVQQIDQFIDRVPDTVAHDVNHRRHFAHVEILADPQRLTVLDAGIRSAPVPVIVPINGAGSQINEPPFDIGVREFVRV